LPLSLVASPLCGTCYFPPKICSSVPITPAGGRAEGLGGRPFRLCTHKIRPNDLALRESRTHGGNYRFLSIRCDCNCDHFHRLPLSVGTFNGSGGLWRTGWRRTAFASVSIR